MWYSDESESHSVVFDSLWPHGLYTPGNSPGQNTGVGSLYFLQGIFLTQGSNPGLLHCRQILYQLSHQGSPWYRDKRVLGFKTDLSVFGCLSLIQKWDFPCLRRSCTSAWIVYVRSQWTTAYCLFCFFFLYQFHWHSATPFHICMVYICFHSNSRVESLQHGPQGRKDLPTLMAFVKYKILWKGVKFKKY